MLQHKSLRFGIGLTAILAISTFAYCFAFALRFDFDFAGYQLQLLLSTLPWVLVVKAIALLYTRIHLQLSRYANFHDMLSIVRAVTYSSIGIALIDSMLLTRVTIPRSIALLDWGVTLVLLVGLRTIPRLAHSKSWLPFYAQNTGKRAIIVGANDAGEALLRNIRQSTDLEYQAVCFVDQRPEMLNRHLSGVPVLGAHADIARLVKEKNIEEVLLTTGSLPGKEVRKLVQIASNHQFRIKLLPSYEQLLHESVAVHPRPVAIADLLRRPSVDLDTQGIQEWVTNRTVMVTGSAGSIGSEICRQLLRLSPAKLVLVDRSETGQFFVERELHKLAPEAELSVTLADLTDHERLDTIFADHEPDIIFHAAAYKHVPLMEKHAGEAIKNIVLATKNIVDLAEKHHAEAMVMISTDKAVNPTSVMGSCKRLAEQYVQAKSSTSRSRLVTVRFGNVLDSAGSVVPVFREQIARGGPVTVTHPEMIRYFMLIPEAAQLVIQAGAMGQGGEIFVLDMGEPVRIMDLAEDMIQLSGLKIDEDIEIEITGLRPGEKLYEELYNEQEIHLPTNHKKIMVAASEPSNILQVINDISHLSSLANESNDIVKSALNEVIPIHDAGSTPPSLPSRAA